MIFIKFMYLLSLSIWAGTLVFFSFFVAPSIFKVLPREQAGEVVGDIFPKYWIVGYVCSILTLGTFIYITKVGGISDPAGLTVLIAMLVLNVISGAIIGGKARGLKRRIKAATDTSVIEQLRKSFRKVHGLSAVVNLTLIILAIVALFFTARQI